MTLIKWDPFRDFGGFERRVHAAFGELSSRDALDSSSASWSPVVEVFERGDDLVIRAEVPGVRREEIELRVENDTLTLQGERKREIDEEGGKTYRSERAYGAFMRRFTLPTTVDSSKISATHKDGVLELVLPKAESSKPRRLEIQAA